MGKKIFQNSRGDFSRIWIDIHYDNIKSLTTTAAQTDNEFRYLYLESGKKVKKTDRINM
jgi:hypothetical protein